MDDESVITFDKILETIENYRAKDSNSKSNKSIEIDPKKRVDSILKHPLLLPAVENEETSTDSQGEGMNFIIPSSISDFYTRLELLLG